MNEIARDTYDMERFQVVSSLMWDGMENQRPAAWKVVFKSLNLLDHLVKNGAERCVDDARNHGHVLRSLGQFNYYEGTIDRGLGVREKSKQILEVLSDDERIREERQKARKLREKFGNFNKGSSGIGGGGDGSAQGMGGYGNQDSWNSGGGGGGGGSSSGYGEGGIYDNAKVQGRYGNSSSTSAPTFASVPGEKKKSKKKKKKAQAAAKPEPAPAPAAPSKFCQLWT
jgi:epsin